LPIYVTTSHIGRAHFDHRLSVTAQSKAALRQKLIEQQKSQSITGSMQGVVQGIGPAQGSSAPPLRIAFLFTGQGSQYPDMGRHLYQSQPVFRQTMDRCDEILRPLLGESILEVIYDLRFTIYEKDTLDETIVNPPQGKSKIVDDTLYAPTRSLCARV
jgi:acyl transferase domain-containing protein